MPKQQLTVVLKPSTYIRGRVIQKGNGSGVPDASVFLWPSSIRQVPMDEIERARAGTSRSSFVATTSHDGSFVVEDVNTNESYCAIAASDELGTARPYYNVKPGAANTELELVPIYGVHILLNAEDADSQLALRTYGTPFMDPIRGRPANTTFLGQPNVLPVLGRWDSAVRYDRANEYVALFAAEVDSENIGTVSYQSTLPGFEANAFPVPLKRVRGSIPQTTVVLRTLQPVQKCTISLLTTKEQSQFQPNAVGLAGYIQLNPIGLDGLPSPVPLVIPATRPLGTPVVTYAVSGQYHMRYKCLATGAQCPPYDSTSINLSLDGHRGVETSIDLRPYGGIVLHLIGADGTELSGGLALAIARESNGKGASPSVCFAVFDKGPYCLFPLEAGRVELQLKGHVDYGQVEGRISVDVPQGSWTEAALPLAVR